jgi:arginyl-tRNA synthetase
LAKGVFFRKDDGSVWVDLTDAGHDQKVILRADGTSVYITQDLGTAHMRYKDFGCEKVVYVVADEQNYHFQVLFEVLKRLREPYADGLHHLSYGLVELPTGRMKTREGTVVDADDLMAEVIRLAGEEAGNQGNITSLPPEEQETIIRRIGLAALKFLIVKVHPHKKMIFNPEDSVSLEGQTGPYVQYAFVRTNGLQKYIDELPDFGMAAAYSGLEASEKEILAALHEYPGIVLAAANGYDPSLIANYCYDLAKKYSRFWHDVSILKADTETAKVFRLQLSKATGQVLKSGMGLLGIEMPGRM